jgi:SAM-dependent methyltransferase
MARRPFTSAPLIVPASLGRNSSTVTALMTPEQSGQLLLELMRQRLGLVSYDHVALLDFGCGVRFTQAIVNRGLRIGRYVGVDVCTEMISWLQKHVRDRRFAYHAVSFRNAAYAPGAPPITEASELPLGDERFDVACLFSVITHQDPADAEGIFRLLWRYVKPAGRLYFTAFLDDAIAQFEDRSEGGRGLQCHFNPGYLRELAGRGGWVVEAAWPAESPVVQSAFACRRGETATRSGMGRTVTPAFSD